MSNADDAHREKRNPLLSIKMMFKKKGIHFTESTQFLHIIATCCQFHIFHIPSRGKKEYAVILFVMLASEKNIKNLKKKKSFVFPLIRFVYHSFVGICVSEYV